MAMRINNNKIKEKMTRVFRNKIL